MNAKDIANLILGIAILSNLSYNIHTTPTENEVAFVNSDNRPTLFNSAPDPAPPAVLDNPFSNQAMGSRLADAHQHITYPGEAVEPHVHPFHEIIYCISGSCDYVIDHQHYHVSRGDVFFIPPGVTHAPQMNEASAEAYRRYSLWFSQEFAEPIISMVLNDINLKMNVCHLIHSSGSPWEGLGELFRRCVAECEQKHYRWESAVFAIALELSVQLARILQGADRLQHETSDLLEGVLAYVESHLSEHITAAQVAAQFWVSESTIRQLFRREVGLPIHRYVTQRRLNEARVLIRSGVPLEQVSISVGFQDYSSFYRAFKAEYGVSPVHYRREG